MTHATDLGDLEIEQDISFQQKTWVVQRAAWMVLLAVLIAGMTGFFGGSGPLAQASIGKENAILQINYNRFTQYLSPTDFQIKIRPPENVGAPIRLWIDRQYLDGFILQNITPEPDSIESTPDRLIYEFPLAESNGNISITLNVRHNRIGTLQGRIGLEGGQTLEFSQFVYP